jgi:pimeloyl-ACP methyl ester carboxylesterase
MASVPGIFVYSSCDTMALSDPFFIPPGAEAYRRDNPNAAVQFLDTGHLAIETHVEEIAAAMREFLVTTK